MIELVVVGEGKTEETFIHDCLAPQLAHQQIFVQPRLIRISRDTKGGALTKDRVLHHLPRILKERDDLYVSTFFDLYGLAPDFPGVREATVEADPIRRAEVIEAGLREVVAEAAQCRPERFVPHIQPHEFEALLLADTSAYARVDSNWQRAESDLAKVVESAGGPEHVNDGPDTHPSARLRRTLPSYRKVAHGVAVAIAIGLDRIRAECHHFGSWLDRIEGLPTLRPDAGSP